MPTFFSSLQKVAELLDEAWEEGYEAGYDYGYKAGIEDQGDELTNDLDELEAYEAERTYDEAYYDPFTRDVDWRLFR